MKISVPFNYEVSAVPPRARNARDYRFRDTVEVEIAEPAVLPVAFRWEQPQYERDSLPVRYWHDGRLWGVLTDRAGVDEPLRPVTVVDFLAIIASGYVEHDLGGRGWQDRPDSADKQKYGDYSFRSVQSSNHDARITQIKLAAQNYLFYDGHVYAPKGEPFYQVSSDWFRGRHNAWISVQHGTYRDKRNCYRADQFDAAVAALGRLNEESEPLPAEIEVLIPEAIKRDPQNDYVMDKRAYTIKRFIEAATAFASATETNTNFVENGITLEEINSTLDREPSRGLTSNSALLKGQFEAAQTAAKK